MVWDGMGWIGCHGMRREGMGSGRGAGGIMGGGDRHWCWTTGHASLDVGVLAGVRCLSDQWVRAWGAAFSALTVPNHARIQIRVLASDV